ncbi:apoptosis-inducing factor 1, mitochondrial-like isoform X2 [Pieris napi]|uniref:apoptosis-inducing factor 1, mitochondrial-like isoform X2 n=1 Tax=Pieris napi TaxID=78633 RepID=UPI001FBBC49C|nr:apoptosis-inducing factor 1, mitochondrial-like isoform X2 [Pieris napi]
MMSFTSRICSNPFRNLNQGICSIGFNNFGTLRSYSKDKGQCCKDVAQTEGRRVEPWPKSDPPPPNWQGCCPREPQPPNYDPYRIKVPDVVVPPLPASNAKPMLECARTKGPCSVRPVPDPPPCPPPPPPPFPWIYVWIVGSFLSIMGILYKIYLWRLEKEKLGESVPIWRPRRKIKRPFHCKDLPACVQYLIIGAGAAGWAASKSIIEHDETAKIFMISKEDCVPYDRPPMSKHMWWNAEPPDILTLNYVELGKRHTMYLAQCLDFLDPIKFYRKKKGPAISIATGWCVLRVDADDHVAYVKTLCGEQPIYYERCLIAPGSKPRNLSIFKNAPKSIRDRVCTLRTIRDLEIAYRKVKKSKHVTIIGAGPLGCELAWHLGRMNKVVERPEHEDPIQFVHIYKDRGILGGIIPEYLGEWAAEKIRAEGVTCMRQTQVYDAFETPDGRLELTLSNGSSIITDYVFVAVGADPRVEIAKHSYLETDSVNGGFLVNTELEARTHLYVAGDAASIYSQWKDTRIRMEHYGPAAEQGYIAGSNMTGYWTPCNMEPYFKVSLEGALVMEVVGEVGACMPTVGLFKPCSDEAKPQVQAVADNSGGGDRPCYKKSDQYQNRYKRGLLYYLRDEYIVGIVFWNMPPLEERKDIATEILRARPTYKEINKISELLGFPETECDYKPEEQLRVSAPCIKNRREF